MSADGTRRIHRTVRKAAEWLEPSNRQRTMEDELRRMLMSLLRSRKRKLSKTVEERLNRGLCIIAGCDCKADVRGVCRHHLNRFYSQLRSCKNDQERKAFEARAIKEELILGPYEQPVYKRSDPYSKLAKETA